MNLNRSFLVLALVGALTCASSAQGRILYRSQSVDSARELAGWAHKVNLFNMQDNYGTLAITPEFSRSFKSDRIARNLFGSALGDSSSSCPSLIISGSRVANRGTTDLLADYFGLPTDFESTVTIRPVIENFLVDFNMYLGLDDVMCGLWLRIHAPIVHTRWKLNFNESVKTAGVLGYDAGYFTAAAVAHDNLLQSFSAFLTGGQPKLGSGYYYEPLKNGLVSCFNNGVNGLGGICCASDNDTKTGVSEVEFAMGWNFWTDEDYHVGLGLRIGAPTGTRIDEKYLFNPTIGNGHHTEIGGMFTSHYTFWRNDAENKSLGLYVDANVTTLLNTCQYRVFDLCGRGENSKYMLAARFADPVTTLQGSTIGFPTVPAANQLILANSQFNNYYVPVANIAAQKVKVSIPVQVDLTAMINFQHCNWEIDLGYNLWATSCERIKKCSSTNCIIPNNTYVLKGDAAEYGFAYSAPNFTPVALSASQSQATIYSGTNFNGINTVLQAASNPNIDHPLFAYNNAVAVFSNTNAVPPSALNRQIQTSIQPIFLADSNLDVAGARAKGMTNAIFAHFNHTWNDECHTPYLGFGGKVEFASRTNDCSTTCGTASCAQICNPVVPGSCATECFNTCGSSCAQSGISQWSLWLKGGFTF